ncbi:endoplasmic reticulum metallopeptidase 1 [Drosophila tropicalis]|uniref:endoplasmic reticulum metallopeptidase 1 n=1 Tax=Drosophila tropicalis TaxID=46794 RepID=UPI0035ABA6CB
MTFDIIDITPEKDGLKSRIKKWPWYGAPIFASICFALFYAAVVPSFYSYPTMLYTSNEAQHVDEFIGERAMSQLAEYSAIGNKMTGSIANEVYTVNFLLRELGAIVADARTDLYDIEVEMQYSSGSFFLWSMAMSYSNLSNVVVKITQKTNPNNNYLLVNSHYDSEVTTPGAADDGVMVVIMLETLRVISKSEKPLAHPVVFLFNGAEEANMLGSHGFITQHRWAPNCKALVNLDSTGAGGREVLFQTGPHHPWLAKYYKASAKHPFGTTVAEELFQNNFIPSDTDFRIFRDYGNVPGLDMAHVVNGYVYHTKYDNFKNLERGTYQTTGDNVLALVWALANAPELDDTAAHEEGHMVYYDFVGWFMVAYTESASVAINIVVSICALIAIGLSLYMMTRDNAADAPKALFVRFGVTFLVQLLTIGVACGLTILVAVFMQGVGLAESWYYQIWMTFGLYFCTLFFVMGLLPAFYIGWTKGKTNLKLDQLIACFMHAHCVIMVLICIIATSLGVRSAFLPMIGIFFYTISIIIQVILKLTVKKSFFVTVNLICQILPYIYYTYTCYVVLVVFVPMQGRDGPDSSPDLQISLFIILMTLHFAGFTIPVMHKFRKSKTAFSMFGVLTIIFIILAATPAGFPFKKDVAAQRYYVLHTERVFHTLNNGTTTDSGFYIQPVERRIHELDDTTLKAARPKGWIDEYCQSEPFCGLPLYSGRWLDWKDSALWIDSSAPEFPLAIDLTVLKNLNNQNQVGYNFTLKASDRVMIFIQPTDGVKVVDWSFDRTPLDEGHEPPYFMYHCYAFVEEPFEFWVQLDYSEANVADDGSYFKMVVAEHFLYHKDNYTTDFREFLDTFPDWTYTTDWFTSYHSWEL